MKTPEILESERVKIYEGGIPCYKTHVEGSRFQWTYIANLKNEHRREFQNEQIRLWLEKTHDLVQSNKDAIPTDEQLGSWLNFKWE